MNISSAARVGIVKSRWPTLAAVVAVVVFFADGASELRPFTVLLPVMAVFYLLFGAFRGDLWHRGEFALQVAGLAAFSGIALAVSTADESLGRYLLAGGWLAHGVWDFVHHRRNRVVPKAWSEWCGVVDVLGAAAIVFLP
ncbi:hypothetical protein IU450_37205 [Nocardia abscessus]|uniref:hypothetical protein n=1 Tax=Nocardia abscessus TaxID=120957 RepID=UPI0018959845|nr:hypothetical protein [Nocardia abscessus]MBF6341479.1 hypothetical protein [Nocardia abscessus]